MVTPTPTIIEATSLFTEEAVAAMCLLSMKASSSCPSDYDSNKILITDTSRLTTNHFMPMPLSTPHDSAFLSPLQCYIRENCIEFFAVDSDESVYVRKGRQTELCNGRVGVRCVYCKHTTKRANQSAGFPKRIEKIYSAASMIQCRHFPNCAHIPKPVKYMLARLKKQGNAAVNMLEYWADSARELGFVDTDENIRFKQGNTKPNTTRIAVCDGGNKLPVTSIHSFVPVTPACPRIVTPVDFSIGNNLETTLSSLVTEDEKDLVQDCVFLAFAQMEPTILTIDDKMGPWKDKMCGEKGLRCRHCQGRLISGKSHGKWYPSSSKLLDQTLTKIVKHLTICSNVPTEVKNAMTSRNDSAVKLKKKYGSRKEFFERVYRRMICHVPYSSLQSHWPAFSPIVAQVEEVETVDENDDEPATAGSKRSRESSVRNFVASKRLNASDILIA